jgi:aspartyl-tRNA(Asn)/glutamyl-tRNA(Gln) amidotransferase subunit B
MFTAAANGFGGTPNSQVDPQVLGLPGTLPVLNKLAVEYSIKVGLALNCKIAPFTKWDRKSYYYPDLPKNYQISQYDMPLCTEGVFEIAAEDGTSKVIRIRRAHLEEDAGKLLHEAPGGYHIDHSIVDLNRAGTPLLEIVTEPDFSSAKQVAGFAQELQKLVQYLGVSEAQMQMGHMRFEPNINVHITDQNGLVHKTAITEIKNLNSFSVLERATEYEVKRQIREWVETGSLGKKSTYGWDEASESTFHQRDKEEAHDYRYFPDPDLCPVVVNDAWLTELKSQIGELPAARRKRYEDELKFPADSAAMLSSTCKISTFFDTTLGLGGRPQSIFNLMFNPLSQLMNEQHRGIDELGIKPAHLSQISTMVDNNLISPSGALSIFKHIQDQNIAPESLEHSLSKAGLLNVNDTKLIDDAIEAVIRENPKPLQDYRAGKQSALGAVVGMVMKAGKGLNPKLVQERLRQRLS